MPVKNLQFMSLKSTFCDKKSNATERRDEKIDSDSERLLPALLTFAGQLARFARQRLATHAMAVAAAFAAEVGLEPAFGGQRGLGPLQADFGGFKRGDLLHQIGLGVVEPAAGGADFEDGRVVGVAAGQEGVDVLAARFNGRAGQRDALLLHHDLVDGAFDLGGGKLLSIVVEQRELPAANVDFVVVALEAAQLVDDAFGRLDGTERGVGDAQHAAGDADRRFLQVAEHQLDAAEVEAVRQAGGEFGFGVERFEIGGPIDLRPEEGFFGDGAAEEFLELAVELDAGKVELQPLVLKLGEAGVDFVAVEAVDRQTLVVELVETLAGAGGFERGEFEIVLAGFEAGELIEGFQGGGGGLVANVGGVELEQVALEADVLLDDFGIALNDHAGPVFFEGDEIGNRGVGGGPALGVGRGEQLVGFARAGELLEVARLDATVGGEGGEVWRLALAGGVSEVAGNVRRRRDAAARRAAAAEGRGEEGGAESGNLLEPHNSRSNGCNRTFLLCIECVGCGP